MKGEIVTDDGRYFYFEDREETHYPLMTDLEEEYRRAGFDTPISVIATLDCMVSEDNEVLPMIVRWVEEIQ